MVAATNVSRGRRGRQSGSSFAVTTSSSTIMAMKLSHAQLAV
jgi:hypothetical protein